MGSQDMLTSKSVDLHKCSCFECMCRLKMRVLFQNGTRSLVGKSSSRHSKGASQYRTLFQEFLNVKRDQGSV